MNLNWIQMSEVYAYLSIGFLNDNKAFMSNTETPILVITGFVRKDHSLLEALIVLPDTVAYSNRTLVYVQVHANSVASTM